MYVYRVMCLFSLPGTECSVLTRKTNIMTNVKCDSLRLDVLLFFFLLRNMADSIAFLSSSTVWKSLLNTL
jgi:hypothetical protein